MLVARISVGIAVAVLTCGAATGLQAQQRVARIQASATVVASALTPAVSDSLVRAEAAPALRLLATGVRIVVTDVPAATPVPRDGSPESRMAQKATRKVAIEYIGT